MPSAANRRSLSAPSIAGGGSGTTHTSIGAPSVAANADHVRVKCGLRRSWRMAHRRNSGLPATRRGISAVNESGASSSPSQKIVAVTKLSTAYEAAAHCSLGAQPEWVRRIAEREPRAKTLDVDNRTRKRRDHPLRRLVVEDDVVHRNLQARGPRAARERNFAADAAAHRRRRGRDKSAALWPTPRKCSASRRPPPPTRRATTTTSSARSSRRSTTSSARSRCGRCRRSRRSSRTRICRRAARATRPGRTAVGHAPKVHQEAPALRARRAGAEQRAAERPRDARRGLPTRCARRASSSQARRCCAVRPRPGRALRCEDALVRLAGGGRHDEVRKLLRLMAETERPLNEGRTTRCCARRRRRRREAPSSCRREPASAAVGVLQPRSRRARRRSSGARARCSSTR